MKNRARMARISASVDTPDAVPPFALARPSSTPELISITCWTRASGSQPENEARFALVGRAVLKFDELAAGATGAVDRGVANTWRRGPWRVGNSAPT